MASRIAARRLEPRLLRREGATFRPGPGELKTMRRMSKSSAAKLDMMPARDPVSIRAMKQNPVRRPMKAAWRMRRF